MAGHEVGLASPIDGVFMDGLLRTAGDPESCIGEWAREGASLGILSPIPDNEVFPPADQARACQSELGARMDGPRPNYLPGFSVFFFPEFWLAQARGLHIHMNTYARMHAYCYVYMIVCVTCVHMCYSFIYIYIYIYICI